MAGSHHKSKRKPSGGIRTSIRSSDKRLAWRGSEPTNSTLVQKEEETRVKTAKTMGGNTKQKNFKVTHANVSDGKKTKKAKIMTVVENKANRLFQRRNILTKGAIIKVMLENSEKTARVTSRPGQSGGINAILVETPTSPVPKQSGKQTKTLSETKPSLRNV